MIKRCQGQVSRASGGIGVSGQKSVQVMGRKNPPPKKMLHRGGQKERHILCWIPDCRALPVNQAQRVSALHDIARHRITVQKNLLERRSWRDGPEAEQVIGLGTLHLRQHRLALTQYVQRIFRQHAKGE